MTTSDRPGSDRSARTSALPVFAAGSLLALAVVLVVASRLDGSAGTLSTLPPAVEVRELRFADSTGDIVVSDARTGDRVAVLHGVGDGFARAVLRTLARERIQRGAGPEVPFKLSRLANGGLSLEDPATGRRLELEAYGPTNAGAFAKFLAAGRDRPAPNDGSLQRDRPPPRPHRDTVATQSVAAPVQ